MQRARIAVTIVVAAGVVGALAWSAFRFLRGTESRDASSHGAAALGAASSPRDASSTPSARDDTSSDHAPLAPTVTAVEPRLEWPDEATLRTMERSGRALFGGIVRAPDHSPCEGATVWVDGVVVATTDAHGAWQADVSRIQPDDDGVDARLFTQTLEARKERVGFAVVSVELPSRRIDLDLVPGHSFSGTVVDFDDDTPIGGAELELSRAPHYEAIAKSKSRADELGRFAFTELVQGEVYVRGRAPGYDSNGFVGYDFSKERDVEVKYRLRKEFTLRGRFVPWPVAGVAAQRTSVRATTRSPHDRDNTKLQYVGSIASDGRFEVAAPVCPTCLLELRVGDQPYWSDELDTNEERRDFDVGDVALQPAAALVGRFDAPAELLARIVVSASISTPDEKHVQVSGPLDAAGAFHLAPLPPGGVTVTFKLGPVELATLENASGPDEDDPMGGYVKLLAGATRDLGVVVTKATICYGTLRDADGTPIAWANVDEQLHLGERRWVEVFSARTDAEGRFAGERFPSRVDEDRADDVAKHARWEVRVDGRASQNFEFDLPASEHWIRHDLVLDAGESLRGTLVDAAGAPQSGATVMVTSESRAHGTYGDDTTRADGSFEIRGLAPGAYHVIAVTAGGALEFDDVRLENGPVTLRPADAKKQ